MSGPQQPLIGGASSSSGLGRDIEAGRFPQYGSTDPAKGLSTAEAKKRLKEFGPNVLDTQGKESFLSILLIQAKNVIFLLTIVASVISCLMGDAIKGGILITLVCVVCTANAIGEWSGQDAGAELTKLTGKTAIVLRDGKETSVEAPNLVPGDIVSLKSGDVVPADMTVLESVEMHASEAVLTGEPNEVLKTVVPKDPEASFPSNMVYSSTAIVSGRGTGEVFRTGMKTQVGLIAKQLKPKEKDVNPLQKSINMLGGVIGIICVCVVITATAVAYFNRYQNPSDPCPDDDDYCLAMASILQGVIMAVAIIPHGLPLVVMIMLRVGANEMGKQNAIVIRKTAVDYLGATTCVCSDKTGTLTEGKMTATCITGLVRQRENVQAERMEFGFYPLKGFHPSGGIFLKESLTEATRARLDAVFDNDRETANYGSVIPDLGDPATPQSHEAELARVQLMATFLNCYGTIINQDERGIWKSEGNMSEAALKVAAAKAHLRDEDPALTARYAKLDELEIPFSSSRKLAATVHRLPTPGAFETLQFNSGVTHIAIIKGAPDRLVDRLGGGALQARPGGGLIAGKGPLAPAERRLIEDENQAFAEQALRSLLIAIVPIDGTTLARLRKADDANDRVTIMMEKAIFAGIFGIFDPPRTTVPPSVKECHVAGIRVVMITGDQEATAAAIGKDVNILFPDDDPKQRVKTCTMLQEEREFASPPHITRDPESSPDVRKSRDVHEIKTKRGHTKTEYRPDMSLDEMVLETRCWARAQPTDKVAIIESLMLQGHIASMTGDGVNDAPALQKAAIGVAMGIQGTAVAQNAADIVLADDNFSTIVAAIREGRKIYANVQKYVLFNLSIKAGECTSVLFAIALDMPLPISGMQLIFNLIVTHIIPTFCLAFERPEEYVMRLPPRNTKRDWIIYRTQWIFRWFPFVVCMACCVLTCTYMGTYLHTGFAETWRLIGTSRVGYVDSGRAACEFGGHYGKNGVEFYEDASPFHCKCTYKAHPWAEPEVREQWGRIGEEKLLEKQYNPYTGSTGDVYKKENTPFKNGRAEVMQVCKDKHGLARWCWNHEPLNDEIHPNLDTTMHCSTFGTMRGQTMGYVTIHLGEIMSLLTYRRDGFSLPWFFTNRWYLGFLFFNISMCLLFIYCPPVAWLLGLVPLPAWEFGVAFCFALLLACLNECFKVVYRCILSGDIVRGEAAAKRAARGEALPWETAK